MEETFQKNVVESAGFRNRAGDGRRIPGTKFSYKNVQLLTSTGVLSLDPYLGGGIAVGTVLLVEEDVHNTYGNVLIRHFLAEGVVHSHSVFLASGNIFPEVMLKDLPTPVDQKPTTSMGSTNLKIAWRYKEQKSMDSSPVCSFDLSKSMPQEKINETNVFTFNPASCDWVNSSGKGFLREPFQTLYNEIKQTIQKECLQSSDKHSNKLLRIGIPSLGSPLWMDGRDSNLYALLRFLYVLRSVLRSSSAAALITVPKSLLQDNSQLQDKVRQMCDYVIQLESFDLLSKKDNALIKDFDGLVNIVKLPVLNTFTYQVPAVDLAFKLRRKTFHIEQLHLPPDVDESPADTLPCSGSVPSRLDF